MSVQVILQLLTSEHVSSIPSELWFLWLSRTPSNSRSSSSYVPTELEQSQSNLTMSHTGPVLYANFTALFLNHSMVHCRQDYRYLTNGAVQIVPKICCPEDKMTKTVHFRCLKTCSLFYANPLDNVLSIGLETRMTFKGFISILSVRWRKFIFDTVEPMGATFFGEHCRL